MAQRKTQLTGASVDAFIDSIEDESKRETCRAIMELMSTATGKEHAALVEKLGRHKYSGGCLHLSSLDAVDVEILAKMIDKAYRSEVDKKT